MFPYLEFGKNNCSTNVLQAFYTDRRVCRQHAHPINVVYLRQNLHAYLANRQSTGKRFYRQLVKHPSVISLLKEMDTVVDRWHRLRKGGRREDYDRMHEMQSSDFIKAQAHQITAALQV